jgi:hypothetical protein
MAFSSTKAWRNANYRYLIAQLNQLQAEFFPQASAERPVSPVASVGNLADEDRENLNLTDLCNTFLSQLQAEFLQARPDQPVLPIVAVDDLTDENREELNLEVVCATFSLSLFDRQLLLLCAGFALWPSFAERCARASGNGSGTQLHLAMAQQLLCASPEAVLNPRSPLFALQLVRRSKGGSMATQTLQIDDAVLQFLLGFPMQDKQLSMLLTPLADKSLPPAFVACYADAIRQVENYWRLPDPLDSTLYLCGDDSGSLRRILQKSCANLDASLYQIDIAAIPDDPDVWQDRLSRLMRETRLQQSRIYLLACDDVPAEKLSAVQLLMQGLPYHCVMVGKSPLANFTRPLTTINVALPDAEQQYALWQGVLDEKHRPDADALREITTQFSLSASQIIQLAERFQGQAGADVTSPQAEKSLWRFCHQQLRGDTHALIHVLQPRASWEDLSLPPLQVEVLTDLISQVKRRHTVYQQWGFAKKSGRGLGISALFAGPSGTGKTLAAEVIARELQLDIYHIDLGAVVSKYIGETEKNLKEVFASAETSGAVLLFDEADSLFGKRMEVKDSLDHYANMRVNYLLQRIESYSGLSILTTNLKSAVDDAFLRRIRFIVSFPFPDHGQRKQIWQKIFPSQTPLENLDWEKLARLNLAGGHIRNIALNAAFFAAGQQQSITMGHLLKAAQGEYVKLERVLTESEVRDWV